MLIRSTLFPINQIKWPQQFQPFLCLASLGSGFFFFSFFLFFPPLWPKSWWCLVFSCHLTNHKEDRSIRACRKKFHQGAIDFINCSGESLTSHLLHKCASGTKAGIWIGENFFFYIWMLPFRSSELPPGTQNSRSHCLRDFINGVLCDWG